MSAIAPQNLTYQNRSVYLTPSEFKRSPIASAIDTTNLVPGGDYKVQDAALSDLIVQASAFADQYCLGAIGTLGATVNTESGRYRANRQGQFIIHPAFWPILEVQTFSSGAFPGETTQYPVTNYNCWIEQRQFVITSGNDSWSSQGPLDLSGIASRGSALVFCEWTYVNGFFNQALSAQATAGSTSINVPSTTGLYAGSTVTIYDAPVAESVTISTSWDGVSTTVPITSALQWNHGVGTNVTALPPTVKQAVTHLVVSMVKQRGQGGFVLNEIGEPVMAGSRTETSAEDFDQALVLLDAFKQVYGRS